MNINGQIRRKIFCATIKNVERVKNQINLKIVDVHPLVSGNITNDLVLSFIYSHYVANNTNCLGQHQNFM